MKQIVVIGAGTMGHGIVQLLTSAGLAVGLTDQPKGEIVAMLQRTSKVIDLAEAVGPADFIGEAVSERIEVKHSVERDRSALPGGYHYREHDVRFPRWGPSPSPSASRAISHDPLLEPAHAHPGCQSGAWPGNPGDSGVPAARAESLHAATASHPGDG